MEFIQKLIELLPLFLPIILIDFGFKIYALIDILKEDRRVRWNNKIIWIAISILINFGWILYFLFGRDE
jgi:4-amino-4-deoxy-L-arabinose transferase-like glycosyltransferase